MSFTTESPVALEQLDDHLKAILKVKLREFVHLSPCFTELPTSIDVEEYTRNVTAEHNVRNLEVFEQPCPNKQHRIVTHRRPARQTVV